MTGIQWQNPPSRGHLNRANLDWDTIAVALRDDPERRWAMVGTYGSPGSAATMARLVKRGGVAALARVGRYEACSRTVDAEFCLYVRYLGEVSS